MKTRGRICQVCGVREKDRPGFFANFPLDESRCKEWVRICGNEDLVHLPIEKLHEQRYVCGDHFLTKDFNRKGNRLKKKAIPKVHLCSPPLLEAILIHFPLHVASKQGVQSPSDISERPRWSQTSEQRQQRLYF